MRFWLILLAIIFLGSVSAGTLAATGLPYAPLSIPAASHDLCPGAISGDTGGPNITSATWSMDPQNSLIFNFNVAVNAPTQVWVEYRRSDNAGDVLTTALTQTGQNHSLPVLRLRANTTYCVQVLATRNGLVSDSTPGSFLTGPLPAGLAEASFTLVQGQLTYPVTLIEHNTPNFNGIVALDSQANVVWYYQRPDGRAGTLFQDETNWNLLFSAAGANDGRWIREITPLGGQVVDSPDICLQPTDSADPAIRGGTHHEILAPLNGRVLSIGRVLRDPFNDPSRLQMGDTILEWNQQTGEQVEVWDSFDFLDPTNDRTPRSDWYTSEPSRIVCQEVANQDWTHANSLQRAPDGNLIMSLRHLNQIIAIAPDFQSLMWRLGDAYQVGSSSDFSFPNPADQFYQQHSARQLPNPIAQKINILLFDNGNTRPVSDGGEYSRALELELDFNTMEARKVWEYRPEPDLFALCCSNVTRLDNGNTVVMFGANFQEDDCCRTFTLVEADEAGDAVGMIEISAPGKSIQYRAYPVEGIYGEAAINRSNHPSPRRDADPYGPYARVGGTTAFLVGGPTSLIGGIAVLAAALGALAVFALIVWYTRRSLGGAREPIA